MYLMFILINIYTLCEHPIGSLQYCADTSVILSISAFKESLSKCQTVKANTGGVAKKGQSQLGVSTYVKAFDWSHAAQASRSPSVCVTDKAAPPAIPRSPPVLGSLSK